MFSRQLRLRERPQARSVGNSARLSRLSPVSPPPQMTPVGVPVWTEHPPAHPFILSNRRLPVSARILARLAPHSPSHAAARPSAERRTKQRPFPHRRLCWFADRAVLRPPPAPSRPLPLPGSTPVIEQRCPRQYAARFGRGGLPSSRRHLQNVPC